MIIDSYSLQINFTTILLSTSIFVGPPEPPRTASESDGKAKFGAMHSILLRSIFKTVIWVQTFFRSKNTFVTSSTATTFLFSLKVLVKALFLVFLKSFARKLVGLGAGCAGVAAQPFWKKNQHRCELLT